MKHTHAHTHTHTHTHTHMQTFPFGTFDDPSIIVFVSLPSKENIMQKNQTKFYDNNFDSKSYLI